ncbi:MAG: RNA-binding protein [Pseudobdellovibrionaceae bacterium]|nr:RNA-binding protein [Bdellovibrionales bacterium]USN46586.1 MAG: RNA-binding protein [Pseudobdellovibrionaceae bacterium]
MGKRIYVGNLPYSTDGEELKTLFNGKVGEVKSAQVIVDKVTGRSKGFGFVEMQVAEDAEKAVEALNGIDFNGRSLNVSFAKPHVPRPAKNGFGRIRF